MSMIDYWLPSPGLVSEGDRLTGLARTGRWSRSSRCSNESNCVEVRLLADGRVGIRDSKLPAGSHHLAVDPGSWRVFLHGVKSGEFGEAV